jgi:hypothetical protein
VRHVLEARGSFLLRERLIANECSRALDGQSATLDEAGQDIVAGA